MRNKSFHDIKAVLIGMLNICFIKYTFYYKMIYFEKIPLLFGRIYIRGINGIINIKGSKRLRVLGNLKIIFDDHIHQGSLNIDGGCIFEEGITLSPRGGNILLKTNVFLGPSVFLQAYTGADIVINENVMIAKGTSIFTTNHLVNVPDESYRKEEGSNVIIKKNVWIGANCIITSGVNIGKYSIVGASSVVTKDVADYCMVAGSPAKIIKKYDLIKKKWIRYG